MAGALHITPTMESILCFDSGIGGLAYLRCLRSQRGLRWIYLADNAYFPFGEKEQGELCERICTVIGWALRRYPSRFVVLLCNTASVLALPELRRRLPQHQFIGTVPAIKLAAAVSRRRSIALLASHSTSRAAYVARLHSQFAADCKLQAINAASLIEFIEEDWQPGLAADQAVAPFVRPILDSGADQLVLGCTHFLHVKEELRAQLQLADPELQLCDSLAGICGRLAALLDFQQHSQQPDLLLLTEQSPRWQYWAERFAMELRLLSRET